MDGESPMEVEQREAESSRSEDAMRSARHKYSVPHDGSGGDDVEDSGGCWGYFDIGFSDSAGKTGTYYCLAFMVVTMIASVITQAEPPAESDVREIWLSGCPEGFRDSCLANQAVLRYSFALVLLFSLQFLMTCVSTPSYDSHWLYKLLAFVVTTICFFRFVDASVFNNDGFAWFARIGGFLFIMLQQVILLDFALSWNESWVEKSNAERTAMTTGLDRWQIAILITGLGLFIFSIVSVSVMFQYFGGCTANDTIMSLAIVMSILSLVYQMCCTRIGSVLTSGVMSAYYAYICFSSVTLNPDHTCNPTIDRSPQTWTTVIGLLITVLSLSWTTYSTIKSLPAQSYTRKKAAAGDNDSAVRSAYAGISGVLLSVCAIFILGSCYYAMVLTNWATQQQNFEIANTRIGESAMWLQSSAGWCCFLMYIWALTAPMIWPERFGLEPR